MLNFHTQKKSKEKKKERKCARSRERVCVSGCVGNKGTRRRKKEKYNENEVGNVIFFTLYIVLCVNKP